MWICYARLSVSSDAEQTGIDRQLDDVFSWAVSRGARRVVFRVDDGISALDKKATRPAFEQMLGELSSGAARYAVAWKSDRLARRPTDAERLLDACGDRQRTATVYTVSDGVDTDTDGGSFILRAMVLVGTMEGGAIKARIARKHQAIAESGRWSGSPRPFGHRMERDEGGTVLVIEEDEAELLRDAVRRVLAGEGISSIVRGWRDSGVKTSGGGQWQDGALRKILIGPRMAGLRILRGVEGSGHIEPIISREEWEAVRDVLTDPARHPAVGHDGKPRHLLTNIIRCGVCLGTLRAKGQASRGNGRYWTYGCTRDSAHPAACGRVWIKGVATDLWVENLTIAAMFDAIDYAPTEPEEFTQADRDRKALIDLREKIGRVEAALLSGTLEEEFSVSEDGYREWRRRALMERDRLEKRVSVASRIVPFRPIVDPDLNWAMRPLQIKRAIIREIWDEITVAPASAMPTHRNRFNPNRITMIPRG